MLNNKGRKFDVGYLKDLAHINKRVVPYINGEKLGSFYIKEWDISQNSMFVKCEASDRLLDFQNLMYEGRMPHKADEKCTFALLFKQVFESAGKHFVKGIKYDIDETLEQTLVQTPEQTLERLEIEPYLPRKSVWDVLQMLCDASMSFVYIDKNDVICVRSELFERNKGNIKAEINTDNAFGINIPFFADMETNKVEIPYYRKVVKTEQELYRINDFEANEGQDVTVSVELDKFCEIEKVECFGIEYKFGQNNLTATKDNSDFKYEISFTINSTVNDKKDLIIYGKEITFEKQVLGAENKDSTKKALSLYTHPDCELIQSESLANMIAARLMELYPSGTRSVTSSWRGTEKLNLLETAEITGRFGGKSEYSVTQIKNSVDGGFKQELKGIKIKPDNIDKVGGT